jgi:hypothetical protein
MALSCVMVIATMSHVGGSQAAASLGVVAKRGSGVVDVQVPGSTPTRLYAESHALVIGAARYQRGWPSLPGVVEDVDAVAQALADQGFEVGTMLDPTRDELDLALRQFVERHGEGTDNRLLVYFSGHGATIPSSVGTKLGYIVPVDAPRLNEDGSNLAAFKRSAYSLENILTLARQINSKHALFVFDSCFSGSVLRGRAGVPDSISEYTKQQVREFIASGDENQRVSDESLFRRLFVAGLRGAADTNRDGYITGSELGIYLQDRVTNETHSAQTPRWGKISDGLLDQGDFVFMNPMLSAARVAAPVSLPRQASPVLPTQPNSPIVLTGGLRPRLNGAAFYEPRLNATIVANGNLPQTMPLRIPNIQPDGTMSRATADAWVAALNASAYLGYRDWRLPRADPINGAAYKIYGSEDGSTDLGYNISAKGTRFAGSTSSELAYLYFNVLEGRARHALNGSEQSNSSNRFDPMRDVAFRTYWVSTSIKLGDGAMAFDFGDGTQHAFKASTSQAPEAGWKFNVIVMRTGDVGAGSR